MDSEHIKKYYQFCEIANGIKLYKPKDFMKMLEKSGGNEVWFDEKNNGKKSGGNESVKILLF
jgi:hypothetical protein